MKDAVALGEQHSVAVRTVTKRGATPNDAILREARLGRHSLIVLGVTRRQGEHLALGSIADTLLEASDRSVLFLAS